MTAGLLPDAGSEFGRRVRARLRDETVIWLTTVGADGTPQPNPVWFVWQDPASVLVYNRSDAHRLVHLRWRPRVSLHLNSTADGGDVVVLTGEASLAPDEPPPHEHLDYLAKYTAAMTRVSGSPAGFSVDYPIAVTVRISRLRGF